MSTEYKPRPSDGPLKHLLIYADRQLVRIWNAPDFSAWKGPLGE